MDATDELIRDIAVKHGVAVGRDDPILILQTINAQLMEDSSRSQKHILNDYKEELEGVTLRWSADAKDKAERILNASLAASKEAMDNRLQESAKMTATVIQKEMEAALFQVNRTLVNAKQVAMLNLMAAALTLVASGAVILALFFR
jgi:hypothetical protein